MSDTDTENRLILNESQRTGIVKLPHCKLVVNYQSKGGTVTPPVDPDLGKRGKVSHTKPGPDDKPDGILRERMQHGPEAKEVIEFLSKKSTIRLREYKIVGGFASNSKELDRLAAELCRRIILAHDKVLVNFLLCAEPGSGKTYFVEQLVEEIKRDIPVEYVYANASGWRDDVSRGLDSYFTKIIVKHGSGRRIIACLDEVDTDFGGQQYLYSQLLVPMAGATFYLINGVEAKLQNLFCFHIASAAHSTKEFAEKVEGLPEESKAQDFLSRIGENRIDLPSVYEDGVERIVRALAILSHKLPKMNRVDAFVLLYIGLIRFKDCRRLEQLITGSLETFSRDLKYFKWQHLCLDDDKKYEFTKDFQIYYPDHYEKFIKEVVKVDVA